MKKAVRSITTIGFMLAMVLGFSTVWANCGTSQLIANYSTGGQLNVPGVLDDGSGAGTIMTKFWIQGQSASFNSGTLKDTYQAMPWEDQSYFIWSNWGNGGVVGGCPPYSGRSVFLYSIENGGRGEYILMSVGMDTQTTWSWDFDAVTNGNGSLGPNTEEPVLVPKVSVSDVSMESPNVISAVLNWNPIKNLRGFYDTDPGKNLITGIVIRYYQGVNPPTSFRSSDWPIAETVNFTEKGVVPTQAKVELPYSTGMHTYVALSLLFDGGAPGKDGSPAFTETDFVGESCEVQPKQEPAAEFGEISANRITDKTLRVAWTMVKQVGVEEYAIYGSHSSRGRYIELTTVRSADSGSYSVNLGKDHGIRFVVVKAFLSNGEEVKSGAVKVEKTRGVFFNNGESSSDEAGSTESASHPISSAAEFGNVNAIKSGNTLTVRWMMVIQSGVVNYTVYGSDHQGRVVGLGRISSHESSAYSVSAKGGGIEKIWITAALDDGTSVTSREVKVRKMRGDHHGAARKTSASHPISSEAEFGNVNAIKSGNTLTVRWMMVIQSGVVNYTVYGSDHKGRVVGLGRISSHESSAYSVSAKGGGIEKIWITAALDDGTSVTSREVEVRKLHKNGTGGRNRKNTR